MIAKSVKWVLDGEIMEDAGTVGGDIQVGQAISARFRSDEQPGARFEVTAYATAQTYLELDELEPDCPHPMILLKSYSDGTGRFAPMPDEHLACTYKPGTVNVQQQYTYMINGSMENGHYQSNDADEVRYDWTGRDPGYPAASLFEEVKMATEDAKRQIKDWVKNIDAYLNWDGASLTKG